MTSELIIAAIPGADAIAAHFGRWPSFHDAEVMSLELNRARTSKLKIYAFDMGKATDSSGFYILNKQSIVTFLLDDVVDLELADFSCQNVIFGLSIAKVEAGYKLVLDPCYGISGWIVAARVTVQLEELNSVGNSVDTIEAGQEQ